jgi:hypothetical protein
MEENTLEVPTQETLEWSPHRRQEMFLTLPDWLFEALYGGAAGGGKTEALYMLPLTRGWHQHPRYKGIILRRSFPELEKEIILRSKPYYAATGARYNEQKKFWTFPNGGIQMFGHAEHEKDITKYDGVEYNYVGWDELTHFTEYQYLYLVGSRVRSSSSSLPAITRAGSNPGNIGHKWVRDRFVEPAREGMVIIEDRKSEIFVNGERKTLKRIFIPAKVEDNPTLMKNDPMYLAKLEMLPTEAEKRAKKYGDWYTFEGQAFNFRLEPLPDEPPNARHVIEPFTIPSWWPKVAAIDWGFGAHTWIGWAAIAPNGRAYIYREYFEKGKLVSEWATEFKRLSQNDNLEAVALDPSAWQERGIGTIDQQFSEYSGYSPYKAINDRIGGKILMHDYLRWTPKPKAKDIVGTFSQELATKLLVNYGKDKYDEYLKFFEEEPEESNLPKLQVFNTCEAFIDAIPQCVIDPENPEDVQEFAGDDPYDGGRYLLQAIRQFKEKAVREGRKYDDLQRAQESYNRGVQQRDLTQFYIHASKQSASSTPFSIRARRRR